MALGYYMVADKRFYEPMDSCPVEAGDYLTFVENEIGPDWHLQRKGIWINCLRAGQVLPVQGWKIHLSATPNDSKAVLETAARYLIERGVSFKFLLDRRTLRLMSSKSWARGSSGKFMTVYPGSDAQFRELLAGLHGLTKDYRGPYILSDKRYEDSKVLYYRFGGIQPNSRLEVDGKAAALLIAPDGRETLDVRAAYYSLPSWVEDAFPSEKAIAAGTGLNGGRYAVRRAVHFSNTGGIYVAHDAVTGREVILKEARAHVHSISDDVDAAAMLRREFAMLKRLESTGIAPAPYELFQEWDHLFLAEEYLDGYVTLRQCAARDGILFETRPTAGAVEAFVARYLAIFRKLAALLDILHANGVVFGDLSANNVLIDPVTLGVRLIDLEGARDAGEEGHTRQYTPGFADAGQMAGLKPSFASDYYAFGALMLYLLTHVNDLLELRPESREEILSEVTRDFGLPEGLRAIISNLLDSDPAKRGRPSVLLSVAPGAAGEIHFAASKARAMPRAEIEEIVRESCRFVKANADYHRKDRLFPADPAVYETNPLSLAHGAVGIMCALAQVEKKTEPAMLDWLKKHEVTCRDYAPGLHIGAAGIAWGLLELGQEKEAEDVMSRTFGHPLLAASPNLYHGLAGWGMANLRFWRATKKEVYLKNASQAAADLLQTARLGASGLSWPSRDGKIRYGLAYGSSGIGLFLLYLHAATGDEAHKIAAISALDHDLAAAVEIGGHGLTWPKDDDPHRVLYPYLEQGSAGIGIVCLRFYKALGDRRYLELIEKIHVDCDRKYTIFPGRDAGLAGLGEFLIDAYLTTRDEKYLDSAYRAAAGLKLFVLQEADGIAFPGNGLARISCDYASGTSGVMLFFERLLSLRDAGFMLDELLEGGSR